MTKTEKALELVQKCLDDWPYAATRVVDIMTRLEKVKELLKEQEPVKVKDYADLIDGIQVGYCPKCDRKIVWNPEKEGTVAFCKYCGQAVKWE